MRAAEVKMPLFGRLSGRSIMPTANRTDLEPAAPECAPQSPPASDCVQLPAQGNGAAAAPGGGPSARELDIVAVLQAGREERERRLLSVISISDEAMLEQLGLSRDGVETK